MDTSIPTDLSRTDRAAARLLLKAVGAVGLLALSAIFIFPFFWMFSTSFKTVQETLLFPPTLLPQRWMFANYLTAWHSGRFPTYLLNSVFVSVTVLVVQFAVIVPAAYAFSCRRFALSGPLFSLVLTGLMIPPQVTFLPVYLLFSRLGLINTYAALVLPFASSSFGIFLLTQNFRQIPLDVIEAARLDRTGPFKLMIRVLLPMAKPAVITFALFSFISHWNDFFWVLSMTTSDAMRTLPIAVAMLKDSENLKDWHVIMAGNMILVAPILAVYAAASGYIKTAFTYSGIK